MDENQQIAKSIEALRQGNEKAFKLIYDRYEKRLFGFIIGYTKEVLETEGIVQETFLKLWSKRETLDSEKSVESYLFKTAYNIYIDKFRRKDSELRMLDSWRYRRIVDSFEEDEEIRQQRIQKIKLAIDELPKRRKEVFVLSKFRGYNYSEIAEKLGISKKTVQDQIVKAYSSIRENLKNSRMVLFLRFHCKKRFVIDR